jgi:hypothetical protein
MSIEEVCEFSAKECEIVQTRVNLAETGSGGDYSTITLAAEYGRLAPTFLGMTDFGRERQFPQLALCDRPASLPAARIWSRNLPHRVPDAVKGVGPEEHRGTLAPAPSRRRPGS